MTDDLDNLKNELFTEFRKIVREELKNAQRIPPERRYLKPAEAGIIMGCSANTVYKLMREGHLPFSNWDDDGVWKVDRKDIDRFFEKRKNI